MKDLSLAPAGLWVGKEGRKRLKGVAEKRKEQGEVVPQTWSPGTSITATDSNKTKARTREGWYMCTGQSTALVLPMYLASP